MKRRKEDTAGISTGIENVPAGMTTGRHSAAVERALAEAPPIDAEQARALRSLLAGYAARAAEDRIIAESRRA